MHGEVGREFLCRLYPDGGGIVDAGGLLLQQREEVMDMGEVLGNRVGFWVAAQLHTFDHQQLNIDLHGIELIFAVTLLFFEHFFKRGGDGWNLAFLETNNAFCLVGKESVAIYDGFQVRIGAYEIFTKKDIVAAVFIGKVLPGNDIIRMDVEKGRFIDVVGVESHSKYTGALCNEQGLIKVAAVGRKIAATFMRLAVEDLYRPVFIELPEHGNHVR